MVGVKGWWGSRFDEGQGGGRVKGWWGQGVVGSRGGGVKGWWGQGVVGSRGGGMGNGWGQEGGVVGVKVWVGGGLGVVEVYFGGLEGGLGVVGSRGGGDHRVVEVKGCGR